MPKSARLPQNILMIKQHSFLDVPRWLAIWRDMQGTLIQFVTSAIFLMMTVLAPILDWLDVLNGLIWLINRGMGLFRLLPEAASSVILTSVRKDGLLLFAEPNAQPIVPCTNSLRR